MNKCLLCLAICPYSYIERREDNPVRAVSDASTYAKGNFVGSDKEWHHGELTRDEAEQALKTSGCDCFLIRHCHGHLILSLIRNRNTTHIPIKYGPGWYKLEGTLQAFSELQELICHFHNSPIDTNFDVLGMACKKRETSRQG